jgi:hypothetical protein
LLLLEALILTHFQLERLLLIADSLLELVDHFDLPLDLKGKLVVVLLEQLSLGEVFG